MWKTDPTNVKSPVEARESLEGHDLEQFLESLEQENDSIPAQCIKFLLSQENAPAVSTLSHLKWSGVDFSSKQIVNDYPIRKDLNKISACHMDEPTEPLLLEMITARDKECPFVFPASPGKTLPAEVRSVLRRVCRRAGLEGITFAVLKRSFMPGVMPRIPPIFPYSTKFRDLPERIRNESIETTLSAARAHTGSTVHQDFHRGQKAAINWLEDASLSDIAYLAREQDGSPTYVRITAMKNNGEGYDSTQLCISPVGYVVQEILGLNAHPEATEQNVQFEAGFHLFLKELDDLLCYFIQRYWDKDLGRRR